MKIYLDTANRQQIQEALSWGILDGVTTNPSLVAKEGKEYRKVVEEVCTLVAPRPVSVEVLHTDTEGIIRDAMEMFPWAPNIVIKVATTPDGLKAISALRKKDIPVNATLIFSLNQAILAIKAGASFVSPFIGRLDDIGQEGVPLVKDIVEFVEVHHFTAKVIAASLRHPIHVEQVALAGAHIATMPHEVLLKMIQHPLTDIGLKRFLSDWDEARKKMMEAKASRTTARVS